MFGYSCRIAWLASIFIVSLLFLCSNLAPAVDAEREFFDNRKFERKFTSEMLRLMEEKETCDLDQLREQLRAEKRCEFASRTPSRRPAQTAVELYRGMADSVVALGSVYLCDHCGKLHPSLAGGVIVGSAGYIISNYHVLDVPDNARALGVMLRDGRVFPVKEVLASDQLNDLALIKIDADDLPAAPVADDVPVGEEIFVISHPDEHYYTFTCGFVSGKSLGRTRKGKIEQISITADYARGSSGAPVFNKHGEIVGLVRSTDTVLYDRKHNSDVQMIWKYLVPYSAINQLLGD